MGKNYRFLLPLLLFLILACQKKTQRQEEALDFQHPRVKEDIDSIEDLLASGRNYLYKPFSYKVDLDSANYYFEKALKLSNKIGNDKYIHETYFYYGEIGFEEKDFQKAELYYHKAIAYYHRTKQLKKEAETLSELGIRIHSILNLKNPLKERNVDYFTRALKLYKILGLKEKEITTIKNIADVHLNEGKLDEAENELIHVVDEYEKIGFIGVHHTYNLLTVINRLQGDFNKALFYALKGVDGMIETNDIRFESYFYSIVADNYRELGVHEKSILWYRKALKNYDTNTYLGTNDLYRYLNYLCSELITVHKNEEARLLIHEVYKNRPPKTFYDRAIYASVNAKYFCAINDYENAEIEYLTMMDFFKKIKDDVYLVLVSEANLEVGAFYLDRRQYEKAKTYLLESLNVPSGIAAKSKIKEANLLLFKIDSAQGSFLEAIKRYQNYKQLNDLIFNETKSRQIEEIQIQYETEKKENEIKQLTNDGLLQSSKLRKTTITKNYIFGGLILFVIVSILLYKSYSHKQKSNRKLTSQKGEIAQQNASLQKLLNEKEWLLKEVHHRVKNNLQIVMSLLNTQSDYINSEEALIAIRNSQNRLYAISLIHQKLYKNENITQILMSSYIEDLIAYLVDSFDLLDSVEFIFNMDDTLLDEQQSVPVGLILNEAITNAIKYAFPHKGEGIIEIGLKTIENTCFILIKDSGIGLPKDFDFRNTTSLGMSLIKGLSEQLGGSCIIKNCDGVAIEINFTTEIKNL
ncbi:sensor histidine kinase [Cellulophaga baltica]|uniref:tetratricopeptide repeat-containing sensor histidine kinase n=1 Tax=Cellulophaga baltica TaxID=76594 RepID=UPI0021485BA3|nr:sensor histidine kinase [Cellulophaga baltica]MCR1025161.1 sensor histidine kinase [Cellulophaga baltica]